MRVLVCGSREWKDHDAVSVVLNGCLERVINDLDDELVVIDGGARGADECAREWYGGAEDGIHAIHERVKHETYRAEWDKHGNAAGPIRNHRMLNAGEPDIVWAFKARTKSPGTDDMIRRALKAGIPVYIVSRPAPLPSATSEVAL